MLSDVEYFKSKMGKIDGSGDLGDTLIQVVNAKTILPEKTTSTTEPAQTEASSSASEAPSPPVPEKDDNNQQSKTEKS